MKTPNSKWGNPEWVRRIAFDDLDRHYTALQEENARLREALGEAVAAGEYVVRLVEANDRAGQSASPTERADWVGTCAHCYGAMAFLNSARAALAQTQDTAKAGGVK